MAFFKDLMDAMKQAQKPVKPTKDELDKQFIKEMLEFKEYVESNNIDLQTIFKPNGNVDNQAELPTNQNVGNSIENSTHENVVISTNQDTSQNDLILKEIENLKKENATLKNDLKNNTLSSPPLKGENITETSDFENIVNSVLSNLN